ncbi:hypothetical protein H5410_006320 [Solanum commersonii]|uniref:Uncharacterized protein n=1 Tax=Solanum commersonii TaxID=4109 RepID=A0A9J6A8U7_SOLCO|nr:hypothetical protein H5410_006320 [Solanum commersonii]
MQGLHYLIVETIGVGAFTSKGTNKCQLLPEETDSLFWVEQKRMKFSVKSCYMRLNKRNESNFN